VIKLNNVTLVAVGSTKIKNTIFALMESQKGIEFGDVILVSHEKPDDLPSEIRFEQCEKMESIKDYNHYIIFNLHKHIKNDYCLIVQHDGYILRPEKWDERFLDYDYLGAPWPFRDNSFIDPFGKHIRVGNGGFSLRSKRLLNVPNKAEIVFDVNQGDFYKHMGANSYSEDGNICVHNRHIFEEHGCKFAPVELAAHFSQEHDCPEIVGISSLGFHAVKR